VLVKRLATTLARLAGLTILLYTAFGLLGNLAGAVLSGDAYDPIWVLFLVLGVFGVRLAGSIAFLLSIDGQPYWRTTRRRLMGWVGMMVAALLPTSLTFLIAPVAALGGLALLLPPDPQAARSG
jgi:hypothetical protein